MRIASIIESIVDGPGYRLSVFFSGCKLHCPQCHNKHLWDPASGTEMTVDEVINEVKKHRQISGVSVLGGEPLNQSYEVAKLCKAIKKILGHHIILYSGYKYEEILAGAEPYGMEVLPYVDILIDGRYDHSKRDISENNIFRGSTNQRIIDVQRSLNENRICVCSYDVYGNLKQVV